MEWESRGIFAFLALLLFWRIGNHSRQSNFNKWALPVHFYIDITYFSILISVALRSCDPVEPILRNIGSFTALASIQHLGATTLSPLPSPRCLHLFISLFTNRQIKFYGLHLCLMKTEYLRREIAPVISCGTAASFLRIPQNFSNWSGFGWGGIGCFMRLIKGLERVESPSPALKIRPCQSFGGIFDLVQSIIWCCIWALEDEAIYPSQHSYSTALSSLRSTVSSFIACYVLVICQFV